jgi:Glycosyl transferases group 1
LLGALAVARPDWQFWFCGQSREGGTAWSELSRRPNVRYFGELDPDGIARLSRQALLGLMPFKQSPLIHVSLPLKAWEYVACGLPVLTVPIDAIADRPDLFRLETTPKGFANALDELAATRNKPDIVELHLEAASAQSYDRRFAELEEISRSELTVRAGARLPVEPTPAV